MLHGGNTRKNTRALRLARAFNRIMEHQYKRDASGVELLLGAKLPAVRRARPVVAGLTAFRVLLNWRMMRLLLLNLSPQSAASVNAALAGQGFEVQEQHTLDVEQVESLAAE